MTINGVDFQEGDIISIAEKRLPSNKIVKADNVKITILHKMLSRIDNQPYYLITTINKLGKIQRWETANLVYIRKES